MKHKRVTHGWFFWLLLTLAILLFSCTKQVLVAQTNSADVYKLISVHYKLDTTDAKVHVIWQDSVFRIEEKRKLDTILPKWQPLCNARLEKIGLEYRYYMKNGFVLNGPLFQKSN